MSNTTSLTGRNDMVNIPLVASTDERSFGAYNGPAFATAFANPSPAVQNMLSPKFGPAALAVILLALYSTALSGLWFVVAIIQPRWGFMISTTHGLSPSNAATLTALLGKTIEIASIAVFISCIGQVLTRRAVAEESTGITLADITIRNWVIQPGFIFTHFQTLAIAGRTLLGALALLALVATILYTTASEALVSPKLKYGKWESRQLTAPVHSYYGNHVGAGARSIQRPAGHTLLHDNVTIEATRVDTEFSDVVALYERWGRIVDNVTVSIPHPGVWSASRFPENKILQPEDLSNAGGFSIKAAVVSPTLNTLCVNLDEDELTPLVYKEFPHSENDGLEAWAEKEISAWDNSTVVDDVFRWGTKYGRRRPVFEYLPKMASILYHRTNSLFEGIPDAGYLVSRYGSPEAKYTICQMRSWLSTDCSTHLEVSAVGQPIMRAHCGDDGDVYRYDPSIYNSSDRIEVPQLWPFMLDIWRTAVALEQPSDTKLFGIPLMIVAGTLTTPKLSFGIPTTSEYLSLFLLSTLSLAAVDTQLRHTWNHGLGKDFDITDETSFGYYFDTTETFRAVVRSQQYTSGHTESWQRFLYLVLGITFALNFLSLGYLISFSGMISDITEPQNHFYLAMSSSPCSRVDGSYPDQLDKQHLKVPWRVTQSSVGGEYQFEKCNTDL
ncbi:hypothetical protein NCS56_00514400 [Fusarium sp. Ph1]|nr:hypothetical protein NCS56_00514400 [Fusarium sp. Ph1]